MAYHLITMANNENTPAWCNRGMVTGPRCYIHRRIAVMHHVWNRHEFYFMQQIMHKVLGQ